MTLQLSPTELQDIQQVLQDFAPAQPAIATLQQHDGNLETSLEDLVAAEAGAAVYGDERKTLRQAFVRNLRREICGDDSFRARVEEYNKNPGKAALLTGLIVYLIDLVTLPINPAIATIVVLWVLKLGIRTFCDYTEPVEGQED
ncbi:hypothetical protein H6G89_22180 [Oscillatoria sp. FACHB-1407]|uniref:hypothetical protein n=1 Tax=Oscillatoria sp. FACHB-1407 TaxID=2692847 RepID=UPI00168739EA|nr:hypothetical protein [Oscillatoria sp. FACHB-1407]MBD2463713.1 hypothetical protein [Oscillatoria sp. FACHB-1407]